MDRPPLLSLCVPTYNRPADIAALVSRVTPWLLQANLDLELCISDNASPSYDLGAILKPLLGCCKLRWLRQTANVGVDRNILSAVRMATGQYVLFLGDDDWINFPALAALMERMRREPPDAVFCNYWIGPAGRRAFPAYLVKTDRSLHSLSKVVPVLGERITFMSSLVLRRELLLDVFPRAEQYVGSLFMHLGLLMDALKHSQRVMYSAEPLVYADDHNASTYSVRKVFIDALGGLCSQLEATVSTSAMVRFRNSIFGYAFPHLSESERDWSDLSAAGFRTGLVRATLALSRIHPGIASHFLRSYRALFRLRQASTRF